MTTADIIHRLRLRAQEAAAIGKHAMASDLRLAIAHIDQMEKELMSARFLSPRRDRSKKCATINRSGSFEQTLPIHRFAGPHGLRVFGKSGRWVAWRNPKSVNPR